MANDVEILKQLIKEVKEEMKSGLLKEHKEKQLTGDSLKEHIVKEVMNTIRESGG